MTIRRHALPQPPPAPLAVRLAVRLGLAAFLLATALALTACGGKTPEEKLRDAVSKIEVEKPADIWGAMNLLRGLTKAEDTPVDIKTESYLRLSMLYMEMEDTTESLTLVEEARRLHSTNTDDGQRLFEIYVDLLARTGQTQKAADLIATFLAETNEVPVPRQTKLRLHRANFLTRAGHREEARTIFEELLAAYDDEQVERVALDGLINTWLPDEPAKAAARYLAYARANPDTQLGALALFGAGTLYLQSGNETEANPLLDESFALARTRIEKAIEPGQKFEAYSQLAAAYQLTGRLAEEEALWAEVAEVFADKVKYFAQAKVFRVDSLLALGRFDEAFESLRDIEREYPDSPHAKRVPDFLNVLSAQMKAFEEFQAQQAAAEQKAMGNSPPTGDAAPESAGPPDGVPAAPHDAAPPAPTTP